MTGRRVITAVAFALAAGMFAGCAPASDATWAVPVWDVATARATEPPPPIDIASDPALAGTLTALRVRNDTVGIQARVVLLPGVGDEVARFNTITQRTVEAAISGREDAADAAFAPEAFAEGEGLGDRWCITGSTQWPAADVLADPTSGPAGGEGTGIVCDVVAATGPFLAQRLRTVTGSSEAVTGDTVELRYADTATGEVVDAADLWAEGAAQRLSAAVIDALRRDAGSLSQREAAPADDAQLAEIEAALATTIPRDDEFVLTIPPGFVARDLAALGVPATTEPLTLAIPASLAGPLLTPFGARVLASATDDYTGPPAVPASAEWIDCDLVPCVALTYDDGPSAFTPGLLDILRDHRATAAFYVLGQYAAGDPDTIRRIAAEGHLVGNHTWDHPSLPELTPEQIRRQLSRTGSLLRDLSGQAVSTFRPPYGAFDAEVLAAAREPAILWTVDTRDWAGGSAADIEESAVADATPGGIVLFHDTHEQSVLMAPDVIARLRDRGFTVASLSQLFGGSLPDTGAWRAAP